MESTGGYENNWYNSLIEFQGSLNIQTARLNPLGVMHNSKASLKKNITDKISAQNIAEYLVAHPEKIVYQQQDRLANPASLRLSRRKLPALEDLRPTESIDEKEHLRTHFREEPTFRLAHHKLTALSDP